MIRGKHSIIRSADGDDAPTLVGVYRPETPRSCLLDQRREPILPTLDEMREMLAQKDMGRSLFNAVEDLDGRLRGFCSLRGLNAEASYSEFILVFLNDDDFDTPMASDAFDFLAQQAFQVIHVNKVMSHALNCESAYRRFLLRHGFVSDGVQRDVLFTGGRWHSLEAFTLFGAATQFRPPARNVPQNGGN